MNRFIQLIPGFKRLPEKLVEEQDPTLFRMAKTWASDLQPGLVSPQALFGSSLCRMEDLIHPRYQQLCREALRVEPLLHLLIMGLCT